MNPVGARIWEMLRSGASKDEIEERLAAEFEVPRQQLSIDLSKFIEDLRKQKLLVATPDETQADMAPVSHKPLRRILSSIRAWYADQPKGK